MRMNRADGNRRWLRKGICVLICLGIVAGILLLYQHYLSGTVKVDETLLDSIEASKLKNNYANLLDKGFVLYPDAEGYIAQLGYPEFGAEDIFGVDRIYIVIRQTPSAQEESRRITSGYRRNSIENSIRGIGKFAKCDSWVLFETTDYQIQMIDYDAVDATGKRFEKAMQRILEIVSQPEKAVQD